MILHGVGEHGGRYAHVPHYVQGCVSRVVCHEHRGHGRSGGKRGHVDRFDDFADDAAQAVMRLDETLRQESGRSEIHVWGHSMGGLITLRMLLAHPELPLASATVSSPALGVGVPVSRAKWIAARLLSSVWGSLQMDSGLDVTKLSHDEDVQRAYLADPLVHQKVTLSLVFGMEEAYRSLLAGRHTIRVPIRFLVALDDEIVAPRETLRFADRLEASEKSVIEYAGCRHEPFNENGPQFSKEQAFADLVDWIRAHSSEGHGS
jgi:alpha-beta hydrolase superfamily lysophospholipase